VHPADVLARIGGEIAGTQPSPAASVVLAPGLVALMLVADPRAWRVTRHVVTSAHEGSHGVAALLSGLIERGDIGPQAVKLAHSQAGDGLEDQRMEL